ncbi:hypothetical protein EFP86_14215 [Lentilactobacillus hilgardii]|nr:hypothetical protein [Lentilactobacillus hilgardii]
MIIEGWGALRFTQENQNTLFIGTSIVDKIHLATAIGIKKVPAQVNSEIFQLAKKGLLLINSFDAFILS